MVTPTANKKVSETLLLNIPLLSLYLLIVFLPKQMAHICQQSLLDATVLYELLELLSLLFLLTDQPTLL